MSAFEVLMVRQLFVSWASSFQLWIGDGGQGKEHNECKKVPVTQSG
jgi:hypothetical protein